jgi:3-hydroxyisobutyrate dehydrogenase/glyoxylate/succinic semialdehyde reductase
LLDVLLGAPVAAPFLKAKRQKMETDAYEAEFPLQWMHKDLHLAAVTAYEQGLSLPALQAVKEMYAMARRHGLAEKDFSAVCRWVRESLP